MRKKSLIRRLIPWIITLAILGGLYYLGTRIYGKKEKVNERPPVVSYYEGNGKPITISNEYLTLEMDTNTTQFVLTENETGRVWRSNPENPDSDPYTQPRTDKRRALSSTLLVTYTVSGGEVTIDNNTKSIDKMGYDVYKQDDGSIRVDYSVGNIDKIYCIPYVITEERYAEYKEKMDKNTFNNKVIKKYAKYTPDKLNEQKNKDELIETYPSIVNQTLYVLTATKPANKRDLEGYFAAAGYTEEDYEEDQLLVAKKPETEGPVFNVSMIYRLDGKDLVVEIPYSEIRYNTDYPITYVSPLPMFSAAGPDEEGFLLIPEGGGAIIRYNNGKVSQGAYYANLYGWDYAMERKEAVSETENAFPVFGATKGDASYICIMEGASSYGGVYADIGGENHDNGFNNVYAKYNVLHAALFNVSNKTAKKFYVYEQNVPDDCIRQRYRFIGSNSYVDMANAYGDYLRETVPELAAATSGEESPVNVELIGAIDKIVVKAGLPVDSVVPATTFSQARKIIDELTDSGVKNLSVRMTGWANGGVRQKVLTGVHVLNELGGNNEMKSLIVEAKTRNVDLYFDGITCFAYHSGLTDGFVTFSNAARYATREQVRLYPYNITNGQLSDEKKDEYYLVKPSYAKQNTTNLIKALRERDAAGVAFRDIGSLLSADYNPSEIVTREQVKQMNIASMQEAAQAGLKVMIKEGNDYAIPYADRITDMNLTGQAYGIIDERIPFYQIALHGMKDYTGQPINLSGDYITMLLECAEYGSGLNFTLMAEDTRILRDSNYSNYTASGYTYWKDQIIEMIRRYQNEMSGLNRTQITDHARIADEVTVTTYKDGTRVYVNYGGEAYEADGNTVVPGRDYLVIRGDGE